MEAKYKNKETGEVENIIDIEFNFNELISNSSEFDEYIDNFSKFLEDFYEVLKCKK